MSMILEEVQRAKTGPAAPVAGKGSLILNEVAGKAPVTGPPAASPLTEPEPTPASGPAPASRTRMTAAGAVELVDIIWAGVAGMPLAFAQNNVTRAQRTVESQIGFGKGAKMTRKEIAEEAAADSARVLETYGGPALKLLRDWGFIGAEDMTGVEQGFGKIMEGIGKVGDAAETASGGAVKKEDVLYLVEGLFALVGVKGTQLAGKDVLSRMQARKTAKWLDEMNVKEMATQLKQSELAARNIEDFAQKVDDFAPQTAYERALKPEEVGAMREARAVGEAPHRQPHTARIVQPDDVDAVQAQRAQEVTKRRADRNRIRAAFAEDPFPEGGLGGELGEAGVLRQAADIADADRAAGRIPQAGDMRGGVSPEAQSGMAKLARGKPLSLTDAERAALNLHDLPSARKGFAPDPQILTAAAVGATGLGLAMMYAPDAEEAALAVGAGALMMGRGRQPLKLAELRAMPATTTLGSIRERMPYTLSTIEILPGNRFELPVQQIRDLLKRPEVTKAERGVLEQALAGATGSTISAKALMAGVKEATGDFELTGEQYTNQRPAPNARNFDTLNEWGLEQIGRKDRFEGIFQDIVDPREFDTATAEQIAPGHWEVYNVDGDMLYDFAGPVGDVTTPAQAIARARGVNDRLIEPQTSAATRIYQSPIELGTNNHFGDPNYFGHTRSFEEGGVRHVVELQSDVAQKAGKVLTEGERVRLEQDLREARRNLAETRKALAGGDFRSLTPYEKKIYREAEADYVRQAAEVQAKLAQSGVLTSVSPMLKDWHKRLIREEVADAAKRRDVALRADPNDLGDATQAPGETPQSIKRIAEAPPVVRFADADTVAKVEGWPDQRPGREAQRRSALDGARIDARHARTSEARAAAEASVLKLEAQKASDFPRFSPEHQGIYDRYAGDVTKFLKQLDGKHIIDDKGHGWWEVPLDKPAKGEPSFDRVRLFGAAALGATAGTIIAQLNPEDREGAAAALFGLAVLRKSKAEAVRSSAESIGRSAEHALGIFSTSVGNISQPLLRRLRDQVFREMKSGHDRVAALTPFVEGMRKRSVRNHPAYPELVNALHNNDLVKVAGLLGKIGDPGLLKGFQAVRQSIREMGVEMQQLGLLKTPRQDYLPRIVTDYKGLLATMGKEARTRLETAILQAERTKLTKTGSGLSELERSAIINKYLAERPQGAGRPGFLRSRKIAEVTPELEPFYAPPEEALLLYARAGTKAIERARFFGKNAVKDATTGRLDLTESIGRAVDQEMQGKTVTPAQVDRLKELLQIRFGPGEQATGGFQQAMTNLTYMGLLGHLTSAFVQFGDPMIAGALHGYGNVIRSVATTLDPKGSKVRVSDLGLVNHISEEFAGTSWSNKALNKVFKASLFSYVDTFGKTTILNAEHSKFRQWAATEAGRAKIARDAGDYFGADLPQLVSDLQANRRTHLVDELLFRELSDAQPISRLEAPGAKLANPNLRFMYTLKSFMLKQADIARRKGIQEMAAGLRERDPKRVARGAGTLLNLALALGVSGAGFEFVRNFLTGRDDELEWGDIPQNAARTFGYNEWAWRNPKAATALEKQAGIILPPYQMWSRLLTLDPAAIQYLPIIGKPLYYHDLGGLGQNAAADQNAARERRLHQEYLKAIGAGGGGKLSKEELRALGVQ